ncbi:MAG: ligand-binding sensor domain-containing protein, partial [Bacteroidota bacterium]
MRKVVIIWLLIVWAQAGFSQYRSYSIRNYKAIDGLPQSQVNIVLEDKNGYLWIGTEGGGLARFDGREFKVYTTLDGLLSNIISYLKLDKDQNLWVIHPRGITKFDGIRFTKFQQPGSPSNAKRVRRAFEIQDTLFFISAPGNIGKIYRDSVYYWSKPYKKNVLVGYCHRTPRQEIMLYLNDSSFLVRGKGHDYVISYKKRFNRLYGIFNFQNKTWVKTDSGYFTVDFEKRDFEKSKFPINNYVVLYDSVNNVFWTRHANNLLKETWSDDKLISVDTVLREVEVRQVLIDSEGNTWFATAGSGLLKYFTQDFDRCSSENMRGVMAIYKDSKGASWVGSASKGLWRIKKGEISSYIDKKEMYRNSINCIGEAPDGTIWVGTAYGLGRYDDELDKFTWFTRDEGLSNASVVNLQFDDSGGLWIGTYTGGVNYYDGKKFKAITTKEGLSTNTVTSLHYSKTYKKLFIGNEFGVTTITNGKIVNLPISGMENTTVLSIQPYRDSLLLIGSGGSGVAVYNPGSGFKKMITTHHGLPSDFIYFVAADDQQYIWIGSEKGITRIKLSQEFEIVENLHYDYDNGLTGVETNQNAFYISKDKKFFGLIDGLYEFTDRKRNNKESFDLHLTAVEILFGEYPTHEYADSVMGFFKIPYNPQLPPDKNHITFHFNRVDKRYPKSVKFKYYLENFDKAWSQPASGNQVTYSNLPPGDYVFRVMATNNEGSWSPRQIAYSFTVRTPFYQTASFIVGMFVLFAGLITLALYMRVKQRVNKVMMLERIRAKEQETLRKEIARDFHDEMGNQLTRIINYISLLKLNGNGHGNDQDLYTKVE